MTIKQDIDRFIDLYPWVGEVRVDCSVRGDRRIFGGHTYRDKHLSFVGSSRVAKRKAEIEREKTFKEAQQDAFQQPASEVNASACSEAGEVGS